MNRPQSTIPSPCVRNCCLDENDVCMGCGRHIDEILAWQGSSDTEREAIIAIANKRLLQRYRGRPSTDP
ncbi:MAG: DUF1289 domain-containing protein [Arenimonas sp.]